MTPGFCYVCGEYKYVFSPGSGYYFYCNSCWVGLSQNSVPAILSSGCTRKITIPQGEAVMSGNLNVTKLGTTEIHTARKDDSEKIRVELLSVPAMTAIAEVMTFGARKYDAHNWRKGFAWSRLIGAAIRHMFAWMSGEDKDPESGLSHLAHAGCCIMFLIEHEKQGLGTDDRYKTAK